MQNLQPLHVVLHVGEAADFVKNSPKYRSYSRIRERFTCAECRQVQTIGIIVLECFYPFIPGNVANATTSDFPVRFALAEGVTGEKLLYSPGKDLLPAFIVAAQKTARRSGESDHWRLRAYGVVSEGIRANIRRLDDAALRRDVAQVAVDLQKAHPDLGSILLECSDLPRYAHAVQKATGLSVFDFITMIDYVHEALSRRRYQGLV